MFPYAYHLLPQGETEDSAALIRELAVHLWGRIRSVAGAAGRVLDRLPLPDRESLVRFPF